MMLRGVIMMILLANPATADAPAASLRPQARPTVQSPATDAALRLLHKVGATGSLCGDRRIQGIKVGPVPGKMPGCGVADAVKVSSVSGVMLSQQAVMDCNTAMTLRSWVDNGLKRAIRRKGGGVVQIRVAAHYACRTRNNQKGAKVSEHGKGHAIDISGFRLKDGTEVSVLKHYRLGKYRRALRKMRQAACGPFGTVLGPGSDRFHDDHFHFDTARHRSGAYCK